MAMTPEKRVKLQVRKVLDELGVYYFFPPGMGLGRSGIPDVICCYNGLFVAIECKAGKGKTTALQDREINAIRTAKGLAFVINEDNVNNLKELLQWTKE